jgi:hypothetical protein
VERRIEKDRVEASRLACDERARVRDVQLQRIR